jgi:hypothetical protein
MTGFSVARYTIASTAEDGIVGYDQANQVGEAAAAGGDRAA